MVRINKYLADCGIASRRKSEELIIQGRVAVNGKIVKALSMQIDEDNDTVTVDSEPVKIRRNHYILLNKPRGVITSTDDEKNRKTVVDLIKLKDRIYPVGRLDYNTTGVLLLTNDGNFSQLLTHPGNNVPREYEVKLDRELEKEDQEKFISGVWIPPRKGRFSKISFPTKKNRKFVIVECTEGRNHFVKNMFEALNYTVKSLNRISYAGIKADIPLGSYRKLKPEELLKINETYKNRRLIQRIKH
jgi:23S rRNA pseudouridine2605 synthase